jgi:hypothetical protein
VQVSNKKIRFVFVAILQLYPIFKSAEVIANVEAARRLHARENNWFGHTL